jgi:hypothetical protein
MVGHIILEKQPPGKDFLGWVFEAELKTAINPKIFTGEVPN